MGDCQSQRWVEAVSSSSNNKCDGDGAGGRPSLTCLCVDELAAAGAAAAAALPRRVIAMPILDRAALQLGSQALLALRRRAWALAAHVSSRRARRRSYSKRTIGTSCPGVAFASRCPWPWRPSRRTFLRFPSHHPPTPPACPVPSLFHSSAVFLFLFPFLFLFLRLSCPGPPARRIEPAPPTLCLAPLHPLQLGDIIIDQARIALQWPACSLSCFERAQPTRFPASAPLPTPLRPLPALAPSCRHAPDASSLASLPASTVILLRHWLSLPPRQESNFNALLDSTPLTAE